MSIQAMPLSPETPAILVIEDDTVYLRSLADILQSEGLQPICCQLGQEALALHAQCEVAVAILDLRLPDMDGLQLLDRLLRNRPHLKVIIHTGSASLDSAITAINRGAFAYVPKAGKIEELLAHVHRAFHVHLAGYSEALECVKKVALSAQARAKTPSSRRPKQPYPCDKAIQGNADDGVCSRAAPRLDFFDALLEEIVQKRTQALIDTTQERRQEIAHDFNNILGTILINTELSQTYVEKESDLSTYLQDVLSATNRAKDLVQQILTFSRQVEPPRQSPPGASGRILLVDDEPNIAHPASVLLGMHGYEVISSESSREALERFRANPMHFDLLITDQLMPEMTGVQLAAEVRRLRPDIPVILCTGYRHTINAETAQTASIDAFCTKPLTTLDLVTTVQQVLQPQSESVPAPEQRILLIEDEDQLRNGLRRLLEAAGYEVVEASNGREGMDQYRSVSIDLIITNILMPVQEGLETIRQLRQDNPAVKIIAISGSIAAGGVDMLDMARRFGAQRTLAKPFNRDELMRAIQDVLQAS